MKVALLYLAIKQIFNPWLKTPRGALPNPHIRKAGNTDHTLERDIAEIFYLETIRVLGLRYAQFRAGAHVRTDEDLARVIEFFLLTEKSRNGFIGGGNSVEASDYEVLMLTSIYFSDLDDKTALRRIVHQRYPQSAKDFAICTSGLSGAAQSASFYDRSFRASADQVERPDRRENAPAS